MPTKELRVTSSDPNRNFFLTWHAVVHATCGALMSNATLLKTLQVSCVLDILL